MSVVSECFFKIQMSKNELNNLTLSRNLNSATEIGHLLQLRGQYLIHKQLIKVIIYCIKVLFVLNKLSNAQIVPPKNPLILSESANSCKHSPSNKSKKAL